MGQLYANLHLHTDASHLDGLNDLPSLLKRLDEIGHKSCAITDHGNMHNALKYYTMAIAKGIKPIIGIEAYMFYDRRLQKKEDIEKLVEEKNDDFIREETHLVLLAKNFKGYQNLNALTSKSYYEGFYRRPHIDLELLEKHKEGIICINGHIGTDISKAIERSLNPVGETEEKREAYVAKEKLRIDYLMKKYIDMFGEDFYLEIQNHGLELETWLSPMVIEIAKKYGVKLVMTNDSHYTWREDADKHRVHMSIGIKKTYKEFMNSDFEGFANSDEFYVKSDDEMLEMAKTYGQDGIQALKNTMEIVDKVDLKIENIEFENGKWKPLKYLFPSIEIPSSFSNTESYFNYLVDKGFEERHQRGDFNLKKHSIDDYKSRLEYEKKVILNMGFPAYFLILWDVVMFARNNGIPVGKGRGSGAGSLVTYVLRITDIDPLEYDLLFERFLNPYRISMPDIDIDFDYEKIDEVIQYTKNKYGHDYICKIGTTGRLVAKNALKDVARVLEYDYNKINSLTTKIEKTGITIDGILEEYSEFRNEYEKDETLRRIVSIAKRLEGLQRHSSQHASGIVISPFPLTKLIPLKGDYDDLTSQYDMVDLEILGFVKMDYLRLRTLTVIRDTIDSVYRHTGTKINIDDISINDEEVFAEFQKGNSLGIFQFESPGMQMLLKKQKPKSIEDLTAINALYRPGPLDAKIEDKSDPNFGKTMVEIYIERASGKQEVIYDHPLLEPILKNTFGIFVYQEQVMQASVVLSGYSLPEADELRKVMGKKQLDKIPAQKSKFINGALSNSSFIDGAISENKEPQVLVEKIWNQIETFARYGFNKSHATAYATLAYQSMWLKVKYPVHFMASVLTSWLGDKIEVIVPYLNEARRMKIKILPPDINDSSDVFEVSKDGKGIHFGLTGIQGVGEKAVDEILELKRKHQIKNMVDFLTLTSSKINKTVVTALVKSGAFDFLGYNRKTLLNATEDLIGIYDNIKKKISANKRRKKPLTDISAFYEPLYNYTIEEVEEFSTKEICDIEKSVIGFYVTHHPLEQYIGYIQDRSTHTSKQINQETGETDDELANKNMVENYEKIPSGQVVIIGGLVKNVKEKTIEKGRNKGKKITTFTLEDIYQGDIPCIVFSQTYDKYKNLVIDGNVVMLKTVIDYWNDNAQLIVNEIHEIHQEVAKQWHEQELAESLQKINKEIVLIEEALELLGDDAELLTNISALLLELYDKKELLYKELQSNN